MVIKKEPEVPLEMSKSIPRQILPIRAMKARGKVQRIAVSRIRPKPTRFRIDSAVVAYLDILGFSDKRDQKDRKASQSDFAGALWIASERYNMIRFNIFSDCAFVCAKVKNAGQLISAIRYAFTQWISDGVLVRGGISIGSYSEVYSPVMLDRTSNFSCDLFHGSGVIRAARLEAGGVGSLLFTNKETANLYASEYSEPIFTFKRGGDLIIGWTDELRYLHWFAGISFIRLVMLMTAGRRENRKSIDHFLGNIHYSLAMQRKIGYWDYLQSMMMIILSSSHIKPRVRARALQVLGWKRLARGSLAMWKKHRSSLFKDPEARRNMRFLEIIARSDSGLR